MAEIDGATIIARSLKQQGVDYMFGVVGFPVAAIAAAAPARGDPVLRLPQRAGGELRRRRRGLPHGPPRCLHRGLRAGDGPRDRGVGERLVEHLADDPDRRRARLLPGRPGVVPGGAPGRGRAAIHQDVAPCGDDRACPILRRASGADQHLRPARRGLSRLRQRRDQRPDRGGGRGVPGSLPRSTAHPR